MIVTLEVALRHGLRAQLLDHRHYFSLLPKKRIAKLLHPIEFRIQCLQHIGKSSECLDAWIPLLFQCLSR
jgi:hypothetical protein